MFFMENCTTVSGIFSRKFTRLRKSWQWIRSGFEDELAELEKSGKLTENGGAQIIWNTRSKFTIVCTAESGRRVVYKQYRKANRKLHFTYHLSPLAQEAVNYGMLEELGFPMAKLLAVGDVRKNFLLQTGYLMTEFAEGCRNGLDFCCTPEEGKEGELIHDRVRCMKFCRMHIVLLAKLHDNGIWHRGFSPANLLWREKEDGEMEPVWIDVASCRRKSNLALKKLAPVDLGNLFGKMALRKEEMEELIALYWDSVQIKRFPDVETLRKKIRITYTMQMNRFNPGKPHEL